MHWNPSGDHSDLLVVCLSDGSLQLLSVKESANLVVSSSPTSLNFRAVSGVGWGGRERSVRERERVNTCLCGHVSLVCWSPKGKQIAIGTKEGHIVQVSAKEVKQTLHLQMAPSSNHLPLLFSRAPLWRRSDTLALTCLAALPCKCRTCSGSQPSSLPSSIRHKQRLTRHRASSFRLAL